MMGGCSGSGVGVLLSFVKSSGFVAKVKCSSLDLYKAMRAE